MTGWLVWMKKLLKMEATLKGKNLLLQEQILSSKNWPQLRREAQTW